MTPVERRSLRDGYLVRVRPTSVVAGEAIGEIQTLFVASAAVADRARGPHAKRMLAGWLALLATCVGAALVWTPIEPVSTRGGLAPGTLDVSRASPEPTRRRTDTRLPSGVTSLGKSIVVTLPAEHDYVSSLTVPLAGVATGRPHGPQVRTVHAELTMNGRVVGQADLHVHSGRFAGTLEITVSGQAGPAELRVADPARPGNPPAVRRFTLAAPD